MKKFSRITYYVSFIIYVIFPMSSTLLAQGTASPPPLIGGIVMDANGNVISHRDNGNDEFGQYNPAATDSPQNVMPSQGMTFPGQNQQHSPGGKNSYLSGWAATTDSATKIETKTPSEHRNGVFQKITGSALWSPPSGSGRKSLGLTQLELNAMFALPMLTKESPFLMTPGFSTWFFDLGGKNEDSPDLYSAKCEFRWIKPLFSQYALMLGATPGYHSAFKHGGDGFRLPLLAGGMWNYNPRTKLILGCMYLDRIDFNWLPYGGVIWTPDDLEMRFEILFPNPKISKRVHWWGSGAGNDVSDWIYVGGELGGDCWSLKDDAGRTGELAYRDYRLMLGYERKATDCLRFAAEIGGLFARNYRDSLRNEDHSIDSGLFLRIKAIY